MKRTKPPKFAERILSILSSSRKIGVLGDAEEEYRVIFSEKGRFKAYMWYTSQIFLPLPVIIRSTIYWSLAMLKNYSKIAFRNMKRYKGFSLINILGLALGMACFFLIFLFVQMEMSYESFHENGENIYRVNQESGNNSFSASTPYEISRALQEEFPEVVACARLYSLFNMEILVKHEEKTFFEPRHILVDPSFFRIFSFPVVHGNPNSLFPNLHSVVISDKAAKKYFGEGDPIGEVISIEQNIDFAVSGVVDIPMNTDFQYDFLFPLMAFEKDIDYGWRGLMYRTFVQLKKGASSEGVEKKIWELQRGHIRVETVKSGLKFQKLSRIHLYRSDETPGETIKYMTVFGMSGIFILLIACINFMNLFTARSEHRAREIGLRKTIGARRFQIIKQFYFESFFVSVLAVLSAAIMVLLILPFYNTLIGRSLSIRFSNPSVLVGLIAAWFLTAVISGSYPAFFLSSFRPIQTLKGSFTSGGKDSILRKGLVIFQFSLSIFFIVSTMVIYSQLNYIKSRYQGFDNDNLVYVRMDGGSDKRGPVLKKELLKSSGFRDVTITQQLPLYIGNNRNIWVSKSKTPETRFDLNYNMGDYDYITTFKMEIIDGRDFSAENTADGINCILNEEAVQRLGMQNPVGKEIVYWDDKIGTIIGVVKNFNYRHISSRIGPLVLCARPDWWNKKYLVMRLAPGDPRTSLGYLRREWKKINPGIPVEPRFFDDVFDRIYRNEQTMGRIFLYFASMTIFISCLGLFGLAAFTAERKTKEVGIRKVLGASISSITLLLTHAFAKWALAANLIAWPLAYIVMRKWLQTFAYQTSIEFWMFGLSGLFALLIALLTVSYQSIRAATANPVDSLRYE